MLWLSDPDTGGQICFWKSRCPKSQQAPWLDRLFSLSMSSPGRVNICVSIRTFIVDMKEADGGQTRWQVIWLSGLFPGALVWSSIIPALLLFWPVCVTIATARESLFRLPSAGNPLRIGQCRRSYLHLIFTPSRAGTWTEIVLRVWLSWDLDRTFAAGPRSGRGKQVDEGWKISAVISQAALLL